MNRIKTCFHLFANVISSISIILLNKWIYSHGIFPNITLSMVHFLVTFLGLCVCEKLNFFNVKSVPWKPLVILALCFCGFVVFTNLSLEYNSVGTFQVAKVLTTPGVVLIQAMYYKKHFSLPVKLTMLPILLGVILCFYYDIHFNVMGTVFAMLGVVITSLYQVLVNSKQSELQLNAMQLLYYQAPMSAVFLGFCIPIFEPAVVMATHYWSATDLIIISISCLAALFVNLTTYWIIGNTSPLTYNMIGHSKFVLITLGGWYLFKEKMTVNQWCGIGLTLFGLISYTHLKIREQVQNAAALSTEQGSK